MSRYRYMVLTISLFSLPSTIFSATDTDSLIAIALETCSTIPLNVDQGF